MIKRISIAIISVLAAATIFMTLFVFVLRSVNTPSDTLAAERLAAERLVVITNEGSGSSPSAPGVHQPPAPSDATGQGPAVAQAAAQGVFAVAGNGDPNHQQIVFSEEHRTAILNAVTPTAVETATRDAEWYLVRDIMDCDTSEGRVPYFESPEPGAARRSIIERARSVVGDQVVFSGRGRLASDTDTFQVGDAFEVRRGHFDERRHRLVFTVLAIDDSKWPIGREDEPRIDVETFHSVRDQRIGAIGDRDVVVSRTTTDRGYSNASSLEIPISLTAEQVEGILDTEFELTVVMRFLGMGFHQKCERSCDVILGERMCGSDESGFEQFYRAHTLAWRLRSGDQVLAQWFE